MRYVYLTAAILLIFVSSASGQNLNCVCPYYKIGPTMNHTCGSSGMDPCFRYYAWKHTGTTCYVKTHVQHETVDNAEDACIPPNDCSRCDPLGSVEVGAVISPADSACCADEGLQADEEPAEATGEIATTQEVAFRDDEPAEKRSFTEIEVPVDPDFEFNPGDDGVAREGTSTLLGEPFFLKVCRDQACTDPKYIKVYVFLYKQHYPGLPATETAASLIALGFESKKPDADAEVHQLLGGITSATIQRSGGRSAPATDSVEVTFGVTRFLARVQDPDEWLLE